MRIKILEWKIFQAETCLGTAMLPVMAPGADPTCGIRELGDGDLREDFERASERKGWRKVKHWDKWYAIFDLTPNTCAPRALKKAYRKLMLKYHPDKFDGDAGCAQFMSLIVNAAKELLEGRRECNNQSKTEL